MLDTILTVFFSAIAGFMFGILFWIKINRNKRTILDICKICGLPEDEHHYFEAISFPKNCKCTLEDWDGEDVTNICKNYEEDGMYEVCIHCEHPKECHED